MTIQIDFPYGFSGQTITGTAFLVSAGDVAGTALAFVENTTRTGWYRATLTLAAGEYWVKIFVSGGELGSVWVTVPASGSVTIRGLGPGDVAASVSGGLAQVIDGTVTDLQLRQGLIAFLIGQMSRTKIGNLLQIVAKRQDGTTNAFTIPAIAQDTGARGTTGSMS